MHLAGKIKYRKHDGEVSGKKHGIKMIPIDKISFNDEYQNQGNKSNGPEHQRYLPVAETKISQCMRRMVLPSDKRRFAFHHSVDDNGGGVDNWHQENNDRE